ncbi:MAG: hypothetical protein EP334_10175 [Gammaproteobacteria bacterium]|nr:MAG: hypothetical protein EP334_10175 [Gammaproteobacteria bacterium]
MILIPPDKYPPRKNGFSSADKQRLEDQLAEAVAYNARLQKALGDAAKVEALIVAAGELPQGKFDQAREIVRMSR